VRPGGSRRRGRGKGSSDTGSQSRREEGRVEPGGPRLPVAQSVSGAASRKPPSPASGGTAGTAASAFTTCVRPDGRQCGFARAWLCPYPFPGGRRGSGGGRHVVRRQRGCVKGWFGRGGGKDCWRRRWGLRLSRAEPVGCPPGTAARPGRGPCPGPAEVRLDVSARPRGTWRWLPPLTFPEFPGPQRPRTPRVSGLAVPALGSPPPPTRAPRSPGPPGDRSLASSGREARWPPRRATTTT
jgi:hypothetical protein